MNPKAYRCRHEAYKLAVKAFKERYKHAHGQPPPCSYALVRRLYPVGKHKGARLLLYLIAVGLLLVLFLGFANYLVNYPYSPARLSQDILPFESPSLAVILIYLAGILALLFLTNVLISFPTPYPPVVADIMKRFNEDPPEPRPEEVGAVNEALAAGVGRERVYKVLIQTGMSPEERLGCVRALQSKPCDA